MIRHARSLHLLTQHVRLRPLLGLLEGLPFEQRDDLARIVGVAEEARAPRAPCPAGALGVIIDGLPLVIILDLVPHQDVGHRLPPLRASANDASPFGTRSRVYSFP